MKQFVSCILFGAFCLGLILLSLSGCDTHDPGGGGFLAEPGPILFVSNESGSMQLYSIEPDGSDVRRLTDDVTAQVQDAVWSPDGRRIALVITEDQSGVVSQEGIYIARADGTDRYRLTGSNGQFLTVRDPIWSPDGRRLAFTAQLPPEAAGWFELFVIDVGGGGLRQIRTEEGVLLPGRIDDWSADGERLLGGVFDPSLRNAEGSLFNNGMIITFDLNGIILDTLMQTEGAPDYVEPYAYPQVPHWSHDERRMAFGSRLIYFKTITLRTSQGDVYIANADGTAPAPLTHQEYKEILPVAWSPDDTAILAWALNPYPNRRPYIDPTYSEHLVIVQAGGSGIMEITPFPEASVKPTSWRR